MFISSIIRVLEEGLYLQVRRVRLTADIIFQRARMSAKHQEKKTWKTEEVNAWLLNAENPQTFLLVDRDETWYLCGLLDDCGD